MPFVAPALAVSSAQSLWGPSSGLFTGSASAGTAWQTADYAISPSTQYSFGLWVRAVTTGEPLSVRISWRDASHSVLGNVTSGTVTDSTTGWTQITVTGTSPANAAFASVFVLNANLTTNQHYFTAAHLCWNPDALTFGFTPGQQNPLDGMTPIRIQGTWASVTSPVGYAFADYKTPKRH